MNTFLWLVSHLPASKFLHGIIPIYNNNTLLQLYWNVYLKYDKTITRGDTIKAHLWKLLYVDY